MDFDDVPEQIDESPFHERAALVIPGGASTGSKRPDALYGPGAASGPTHYRSAIGCIVTDLEDREYVDCTMALGAVAIGYADPAVTEAVMLAAGAGNVCGLSPALEPEVAERLCQVIPCAEQVRFLKTGAEAVSAAIRIARAATGRSRIVGCGYFGWHDWSATSNGVPASARAELTTVPFDDIPALERAVTASGDTLAAVIIEPVIERLPSVEWIKAARTLCDRTGAVLIFDEMKTGFRLKTGGYQEYIGVDPDLAAFGKAMANGYPLAAVVGRAAVMEAAESTWISSTLASETTALAAANAVLDWHDRVDVCAALWRAGDEMREAVERAVMASQVPGITVEGIGPMWHLRFEDDASQTRFLEGAAAHGVLFKRGAYNYPALAHEEDIIVRIEAAASSALVELRESL